MKPEDLERILISERTVEPSASFASHVMSRVRDQAAEEHSLPFPWVPFLALAVIAAILAVWTFPAASVAHAVSALTVSMGRWILSQPGSTSHNALLSGFVCLLGTLLLVRISLRLAGGLR